jgi:LuxR family maltose regulon positive regulatory protein
MEKGETLIQTKLHPPLIHSNLVPRPQLQERIEDGIRGPLTLITAPAGFGKTTLAAACLAECGLRFGWLSLDKEDNQAGKFLRYLAAALQKADERVGLEITQQRMADFQQVPPEFAMTSVINELDAANAEIVLVLDDYQFINSQAVHEQVKFLLNHQPDNLHLLVLSRSDPSLPCARLRACGRLVELRADDLRFTKSEVVHFLGDVMGLHLDEDSAAILENRTEGWIAGLQMAALSLRGQKNAESFIREFAGTNRFIMDFMMEEVLAHETEEVKSFLLQTSVLSRLSGPLCDAVTGTSTSQTMLEQLERRNLFLIPLDGERRWYRYHHLFADLLQARLNHSNPGQAKSLRSYAAVWCDKNGQAGEAVSYALAARNHPLSSELIERYYPQVLGKGEVETVWSWLTALPGEEIRKNVALGIGTCWVLWLKGQIDKIGARLADIEQAFNEWTATKGLSPEAAALTEYPTHITLLKSIAARQDNDFGKAITLAERALKSAPNTLPEPFNAQLHSLIFLALGSAYDGAGELEKAISANAEVIRLSQLGSSATGIGLTIRLIAGLRLLGRLQDADAACQDSLEYLKTHGMQHLPAAGVVHVAVSEILVERNELEGAEKHLTIGMELGKWSGRLDAVKNAAYALSRLKRARQDPDGAYKAIQEAELALGKPPAPLAKAEMLALKARIHVWQGRLIDAKISINEAIKLAGRDRGLTTELVSLAAARVFSANSGSEETIATLTQSIHATEKRGLAGAAIELHILRGLAHQRRGKPDLAKADLETALVLAEPEDFMRIFIEEGPDLRNLLNQWLTSSGSSPLRAYAVRILSQFEHEPQKILQMQVGSAKSQGLIDPMSHREIEVLRIMAQGKTNLEIASQLIVAPGTIKAHTASIYQKLDVANRTEAVARARQLGILP